LIQDTKHLASFWVSESLIPEIEHCENIMVTGRPFNLTFDPQGNLLSERGNESRQTFSLERAI
jgi:hypothetical protein